MARRGEEQSINLHSAATVPRAYAGVAHEAGRSVVVVTGDVLVDFVLEADGRTTPHLAGGSFNAARTLGRLGLGPVFVGRLSSDRYGRALREALEESGVRLDGVVTTDDPTTFARVEVDGHGAASYRFYVEGTSAAGLLPEEARAAMPPRSAGLHIAGLGLAVEPQAGAIVSLARGTGPETLVLVDPSCRAETVRARDLYRDRLRELLRMADVVKASEEDLAYLDPDRTPYQTARGLLEWGPSLVLLTDGTRGATVLTTGFEAKIEAPSVQVVDTIGAGDAFGAAWLGAWVADGHERADLGNFDAIVRTAEFAAVVAARTCERAGAEPPRAVKVDAEWCFAW
jgi:fructokinase